MTNATAHTPTDADHQAAVDLLLAARDLFARGCAQMQADVRESLKAALEAGAMLEARVRLLPNPHIEMICEPLGGEERILFALALPIALRPTIN
jgi:hypothetical protein